VSHLLSGVCVYLFALDNVVVVSGLLLRSYGNLLCMGQLSYWWVSGVQ
jgi:hypothetical protein